MRIRRIPILIMIALAVACGGGEVEEAAVGLADANHSRAERLKSLLSTLAADSMEGRRTGTEGAAKAARFLAAELERYGVEPAGDDGYFQTVPMARVEIRGRERLTIASATIDFDTISADRILDTEVNVVGIIRGSDPEVAGEAVILGAHFDHVGIGQPVDGDSIYNGADDDGSGTVAVLEIARDIIDSGTPPRRTIIILLSTAEEMGLLGTRYYIDNPVIPMEQTVADLQIEMIGRPDQLSAAGSPIVADTRLDQNFFFRSDNIAFARLGIPAHTLSSFNMHTDYHQPSDEVDMVDFGHMAALVDAAVEAVRFLADGPKPAWKEGGMEGLGN